MNFDFRCKNTAGLEAFDETNAIANKFNAGNFKFNSLY